MKVKLTPVELDEEPAIASGVVIVNTGLMSIKALLAKSFILICPEMGILTSLTIVEFNNVFVVGNDL